MTPLHVLTVLAVGACIGYVTNYIAVKMLFRPYRPVKIGKFTLPFTPGVIPKNKGRIAKACGNAIAGSLFTAEDICKSVDSEAIAEAAAESINLDVRLDSFLSEESLDSIEEKLSEKIADRAKEFDFRSFVVDKGAAAITEKMRGTMLGMFINPGMVESFADPICESIVTYLDNEGRVKIQDMVTEEIESMARMPVSEVLDEFSVDYKAIVRKVVADFAENSLQKILPEIDIAGVVEEKINGMDVHEFEKLVLSVMKKELNAIVNLGALIGLVIGLINLLVL